MPGKLKCSRDDNEYGKFIDVGGQAGIAVLDNWTLMLPGNVVERTTVSSTIDDWSYQTAADGEVYRIRVTYTDDTKCEVDRVERTV